MKNKFEVMITYDIGEAQHHRGTIDESYFEWVFSQAEGKDVTVLFRTNWTGMAYYHSKYIDPLHHENIPASPDQEAYNYHKVVEMCERLDLFGEAVKAAKRHGVKIMAWFNLFEWQCIRAGYIEIRDRLWHNSPRKYWCNRDQSRFYHGIPVLGDPEVQERIVNIMEELCAYESDGIYISSRTHSWQPGLPVADGWKHPEEFGFDEFVVRDYLDKYGINICYEDFDRDKWDRIKGAHLTEMLRSIQGVIRKHDQRFIFGTFPYRTQLVGNPQKNHPLGQAIQLYKDWEYWAEEALIDGLCRESECPHVPDLEEPEVEIFNQTLPADFPLYTWTNAEWFHSRGGGPFSCRNWDLKSIEMIREQIALTRQAGCAGAIIHILYPTLFIDTKGESHGHRGPVPKDEYWAALRID